MDSDQSGKRRKRELVALYIGLIEFLEGDDLDSRDRELLDHAFWNSKDPDFQYVRNRYVPKLRSFIRRALIDLEHYHVENKEFTGKKWLRAINQEIDSKRVWNVTRLLDELWNIRMGVWDSRDLTPGLIAGLGHNEIRAHLGLPVVKRIRLNRRQRYEEFIADLRDDRKQLILVRPDPGRMAELLNVSKVTYNEYLRAAIRVGALLPFRKSGSTTSRYFAIGKCSMNRTKRRRLLPGKPYTLLTESKARRWKEEFEVKYGS